MGERLRRIMGSAPGLAVDELAQDVGVTGVAGGLLQEVDDDPAQVDAALVIGLTIVVERRSIEYWSRARRVWRSSPTNRGGFRSDTVGCYSHG